jgi:uncharacterized small protein (DUF1192 family)
MERTPEWTSDRIAGLEAEIARLRDRNERLEKAGERMLAHLALDGALNSPSECVFRAVKEWQALREEGK